MSDFEVFWEFDDSDWGEGILLEKYNGRFSLINANKSKKSEGTIWRRWVFPQGKDKKPIDKSLPWKIELGDQREAINILKYFLKQLGGLQEETPDIPPIPEDDISF